MSRPVTEPGLDRRFAAAKGVADAVLYEGYVLYPYRASAQKNQMRWQFGVIAPRGFTDTDASESCAIRSEVVVETRATSCLHVRVRALQVQARNVEAAGSGGFQPVGALEAGGEVWTSFDEAVEHHVDLVDIDPVAVAERPKIVEVAVPGGEELEAITAADGSPVGRIVRRRLAVDARVTLRAEPWESPYPLTRFCVEVENVTDWSGPAANRDDITRRALAAVHVLVAVDGGRFVSMLDPPQFAAAAVASCTNRGTFPVLVGDDVVLSSPIILYDHPAVAPESEGDMFDATEIDEILALRVLTLTDDEKREARGTDRRAAAIIDRCDAMGPEALGALHGTFRSIRPVEPEDGGQLGVNGELPWWEPEVDASFDPFSDTVDLDGTEVGKGTRVRLHPGRRSDAQDVFFDGRSAEVAGVFHEVDGEVYLAVVVADAPAADLHQWHGRYLYFHPDEIEVSP
ncbi:MAG: hypothetical protein ACYC1D_11285 [Acidimicrobiales bacterium]